MTFKKYFGKDMFLKTPQRAMSANRTEQPDIIKLCLLGKNADRNKTNDSGNC